MRTPEMPHWPRPKQFVASRKKQLEPSPTNKHSNSKRARHVSPILPKSPAPSPPESPEASSPAPAKRAPQYASETTRKTPRRKAAQQADESGREAREKKTPPDWSEASEEEQAPQPISRVRQTDRVTGQEFVIAFSTESSDLSNVEPTASRSMPRRSDTTSRSKA